MKASGPFPRRDNLERLAARGLFHHPIPWTENTVISNITLTSLALA
jgi:hypothetical protein